MRIRALLIAGAVIGAAGCGDDNNNNTTTGTSTCAQTAVADKQVSINDTTMTVVPFTTTATGRVDVTVQWTTPSGVQVGAFIAPTGSCNQSQFTGNSCTFTGRSAGTGGDTGSTAAFTGSSPGKFATQSVPAGSYDLILTSYGAGTGVEEPVSAHIVSSVGTNCPAFP